MSTPSRGQHAKETDRTSLGGGRFLKGVCFERSVCPGYRSRRLLAAVDHTSARDRERMDFSTHQSHSETVTVLKW